MYANPAHFGNNWKRLSHVVGAKIFRHLMHLIVNRLMESDRLIIEDGVSLFIGTIKNDPDSVAKRYKKRQIYWENPGYRRGLVMMGFDHKFFFRMPLRRRREMVERIKAGQDFYNQLKNGSIVNDTHL